MAIHEEIPIENGGELVFFPPGYNVYKGEDLNAMVLAIMALQAGGGVDFAALVNAADDAAAQALGVPVGGLYRNGSVVQGRVA